MKVEFNSENQEKDLFDKLFEEQQNKLNSEKKLLSDDNFRKIFLHSLKYHNLTF